MPTVMPTMDLTDRLLYLRSIAVLANLPAPDLVVVARSLQERTYAAGEVLVRQRETATDLHLVVTGRVSLSHDGKEIGVVEAPTSLGFLSLMARSNEGIQATALEDTRALVLDGDAVIELIEDHIPILFLTFKAVAENLLIERREHPHDLNFASAGEAVVIPTRTLDAVERIVFLRTMGAFSRASINSVVSISEHLSEARFAPGQRIWQIGDPVEQILLMVTGTIACKDKDGRVFRYRGGGAVGGLEAFAGAPRWFEAVAETPILALRSRPDELLDMFEDNHEMGFRFLSMIAADLLADWVKKIGNGLMVPEMLRDLQIFGSGPAPLA